MGVFTLTETCFMPEARVRIYVICAPESTFLPCQACPIDATSVVLIVVHVNSP